MDILKQIFTLMIFPGGLFLFVLSLLYTWINRKLIARLQNRVGPRWFQPLADIIKLLTKEEIVPGDGNAVLFIGLPIVALAGVLTAALYVPIAGLPPAFNFPGDLIAALYLLGLVTLCTGLAGTNPPGRYSLVGVTRTLTQFFSYEAPFLLALIGPAIVTQSWQIGQIVTSTGGRWLVLTQPITFIIALVALMGKLEMPPFDAPEAETEIVAGALTEYSGRGLALFYLGRNVELVVGLTLIAALYLGGFANPLAFFAKTLALLVLIAFTEVLVTRLRIDQTVGLWWRYGTLLAILQLVIIVIWRSFLA
jgi:NADH-quinone oxidoreductase subunit H